MNDNNAWCIDGADAVVAEIRRELEDMRSTFPDKLAKGRLKQEEADYLEALVAEILADLAVAFGDLPPFSLMVPPEGRYVWADKVRWIRGEIERREANYPMQVDKGRLTREQADGRLFAIRQLYRLYWEKGFAWTPTGAEARAYLKQLYALPRDGSAETREAIARLSASDGASACRAEARAHIAHVFNELHGQGRLVA